MGSTSSLRVSPTTRRGTTDDEFVLRVTAGEGDDVVGGGALCREGDVVAAREEIGIGCPAGQRPRGQVELHPPVRFRLEQIGGEPAAGAPPL